MPQIIIKDGIMTVGGFPTKVGTGIVSYREPMKYQMYHKREQDEFWIGTTLFYNDLGKAACEAEDCARDKIKYGGTAVRERKTKYWIVRFPFGGGHPEFTWEPYSKEVMLALQHKAEVQKETKKDFIKGCPDCTDGFYYPLIGLKEPCSTCATQTFTTSTDEKISGINALLHAAWNKVLWTPPNPERVPNPKSTGFGCTVCCTAHIQPEDMNELIIDRLVDNLIAACDSYNKTVFFQSQEPKFNIIIYPNGGKEIDASLQIGFA